MNPSAANWIPKYISLLRKEGLRQDLPDDEMFYQKLLESGFIYGLSIKTLLKGPVSSLRLTHEELTKLNLFHALLHAHFSHRKKADFNEALRHILEFYDALDKGRQSVLSRLIYSNGSSQKLEKVLSARLQETSSFLNRDVSGILTYALIYVDVITYQAALATPDQYSTYAQEVESTVISCCYLALSSKRKKNKYDRLLIELFESSTDYLLKSQETRPVSLEELPDLQKRKRNLRRYLLDLCTIAVWDDHQMDEEEYAFLIGLTRKLGLEPQLLQNSLEHLSFFMSSNKTSIKLFEYANPVKYFYKHSTATVKLLIIRNRKRLQQELNESGELLKLISQSTRRELSAEEKIKVRKQLLDICKTIPSLTVFLLPGGSLLLPILIKFIPELLPSSFRENRLEN